jgi:hypothetical protein
MCLLPVGQAIASLNGTRGFKPVSIRADIGPSHEADSCSLIFSSKKSVPTVHINSISYKVVLISVSLVCMPTVESVLSFFHHSLIIYTSIINISTSNWSTLNMTWKRSWFLYKTQCFTIKLCLCAKYRLPLVFLSESENGKHKEADICGLTKYRGGQNTSNGNTKKLRNRMCVGCIERTLAGNTEYSSVCLHSVVLVSVH